MVGVAHVEHVRDVRVRLQCLGDALRVALLLAQAHAQRFQAAQHQPAVERVKLVALAHGGVEQRLQQRVVAQDQKARQHVVMAAQVFRTAVNDHVSAQFKRLLEIHGQEGVVHREHGAVRVGRLAHGGDVGHLHGGVRGRFQKHQARVRLERCRQHVGVGQVHVIEFEAVLRVDVAEQAIRAAVQVVAYQHVVAGAQKLQQRGDSRHAAGKRHGLLAAFQQRDGVLKLQARGVAAARIAVARGLAPGRMRERCRLIQRIADGTRARIDTLVAAHRDGIGVPTSVFLLVNTKQTIDFVSHCLKAGVVHERSVPFVRGCGPAR